VLGIIKLTQKILKADGSSSRPTTSTVKGAIVIYSLPAMMLLRLAKRISTLYIVAVIHIVRQITLQANIQSRHMLIRPIASLK
jgi:hypothetical protein